MSDYHIINAAIDHEVWYAMKYTASTWCITNGISKHVIERSSEEACKRIAADHNRLIEIEKRVLEVVRSRKWCLKIDGAKRPVADGRVLVSSDALDNLLEIFHVEGE